MTIDPMVVAVSLLPFDCQKRRAVYKKRTKGEADGTLGITSQRSKV